MPVQVKDIKFIWINGANRRGGRQARDRIGEHADRVGSLGWDDSCAGRVKMTGFERDVERFECVTQPEMQGVSIPVPSAPSFSFFIFTFLINFFLF